MVKIYSSLCKSTRKPIITFSFFKFLFIYFWLHCVFIVVHRLSSATASRGYPSLQCTGFSLQWPLWLHSMSSGDEAFSSCSMWAQQLWCIGLAALWHVGSSQIRYQTRVPYIGRQILNHWTSREISTIIF